jgi:hypothetical protein
MIMNPTNYKSTTLLGATAHPHTKATDLCPSRLLFFLFLLLLLLVLTLLDQTFELRRGPFDSEGVKFLFSKFSR